MGIYGYYARVTLAELERARVDDQFRHRVVYERWAAEAAQSDGQARGAPMAIAADKAWNGIFYVLRASGLPRRLVDGQPISDDDEPPTPRFLSPDEVVEIANHIGERSFVDLVEAADPEVAGGIDRYRLGSWDEDDKDFVSVHGQDIPAFFAAAAVAGDAVVVHLEF